MFYSTDPTARSAFIAGLRDLASYLETHPAVPVPRQGAHITLHTSSTEDGGRDQVNHIACVLGATTTDDTRSGGHYRASRDFGPVLYEAVSICDAYTAFFEAQQSYNGCIIPDA